MSDIEKADIALGKSLASEKKHPAVRVLSKLGKLGDQEPLYVASAVVIGYALAQRNVPLARTGLAMFAGLAAADAGKTLVKRHVRRTRPHVLLDEGRYASQPRGSEQKPEQSFPSGHVAGSVAVARAISRQYPAAAPWSTAVTAVIAITRLLKGAHWPLDVAAGAVIGLAAEAVSAFALEALGLRLSQRVRER